MTTQQRMRRYWIAAHLYLGLTAGVVFALSGLTGSILVFYIEIDRWLNPDLVVAPSQSARPQPYAAVVETLQMHFPDRTRAWRIEVPTSPDKAIYARYYQPKERAHLGFAPLVVAINPYTLEIINQRFWGDDAMTWVYDLHYTLLMDKTGRLIMGIVGVLLVISIISGVYLWWPKRGKRLLSLSPRWRSGYLRKLYDIHTLTSIYSMLVLLALLITGLVLEVPQWFKPTIDYFSPTFEAPKPESVDEDYWLGITIDEAIEIAQSAFPQAKLRWLETPQGDFGTYLIRLKQPNEVGDRFPKTYVWIDQYSGEVLAVRNPQLNHAGDSFMDWQHPLHSGEAFGLWGRCLVFLSGLVPLILLITGYLRWKRKL